MNAENAAYVKLATLKGSRCLPPEVSRPLFRPHASSGFRTLLSRIVYREPVVAGGGFFLYRMYDAEDRALYIGQSLNVEQRLRAHACNSVLVPMVVRIELEEYGSRSDVMFAEEEAIGQEWPWLNTAYNPFASARYGHCPCPDCYFADLHAYLEGEAS